ncbi:hypothetical protein SNEBB_006786 [Seison nebaliae]|nr:hypothetical protein SNEBB_006786 [Seison nebaliae]
MTIYIFPVLCCCFIGNYGYQFHLISTTLQRIGLFNENCTSFKGNEFKIVSKLECFHKNLKNIGIETVNACKLKETCQLQLDMDYPILIYKCFKSKCNYEDYIAIPEFFKTTYSEEYDFLLIVRDNVKVFIDKYSAKQEIWKFFLVLIITTGFLFYLVIYNQPPKSKQNHRVASAQYLPTTKQIDEPQSKLSKF